MHVTLKIIHANNSTYVNVISVRLYLVYPSYYIIDIFQIYG